MKKPMKRLTVILLAVLLAFVGVYGGFCIYTINTRYPAAPLVEYSLGDTVEVNGFSLRAEELTILSEEERKHSTVREVYLMQESAPYGIY